MDPITYMPTLGQISSLSVLASHAPSATHELEQSGIVIGNLPVITDDLTGYFEYLKQTNWPRYVQEKGPVLRKELDAARKHYSEGCRLADADQHERAIVAYTKAIDLFPLLYEALDNRGFSRMDLHLLQEAILDFEASLEVNPDNAATFFHRGVLSSIGKCSISRNHL